jgi:hypothetical protein
MSQRFFHSCGPLEGRQRFGDSSLPVVCLLLGMVSCSRPGQIYVDRPEVFTRERLVNRRLQEQQWLETKLGERFETSNQGYRDVREFSAIMAGLSGTIDPLGAEETIADAQAKSIDHQIAMVKKRKELNDLLNPPKESKNGATTTADDTGGGGDGSSKDDDGGGNGDGNGGDGGGGFTAPTYDEARQALPDPTVAPSAAKLTKNESLRDEQAYRDFIQASLREKELDDTHDLRGFTLYTLKFDVTVMPGKPAGYFNDDAVGRVRLDLVQQEPTVAPADLAWLLRGLTEAPAPSTRVWLSMDEAERRLRGAGKLKPPDRQSPGQQPSASTTRGARPAGGPEQPEQQHGDVQPWSKEQWAKYERLVRLFWDWRASLERELRAEAYGVQRRYRNRSLPLEILHRLEDTSISRAPGTSDPRDADWERYERALIAIRPKDDGAGGASAGEGGKPNPADLGIVLAGQVAAKYAPLQQRGIVQISGPRRAAGPEEIYFVQLEQHETAPAELTREFYNFVRAIAELESVVGRGSDPSLEVEQDRARNYGEIRRIPTFTTGPSKEQKRPAPVSSTPDDAGLTAAAEGEGTAETAEAIRAAAEAARNRALALTLEHLGAIETRTENVGTTGYVYSVEPKEYAQNISDVAAVEKLRSMVLALKASLPQVPIGQASGYLNAMNQSQNRLHAILRRPLVVGYGTPKEFGWVFGPRFEIGDRGRLQFRQGYVQHSVQATIAVPAWRDSIRLDGSYQWGNTDPISLWGPRAGKKVRNWALGTPQASEVDFEVPADMRALTRSILALDAREQRSPTLLQRHDGQPWLVTAGSDKPQMLLIHGTDLWRNPSVFVGSQRASVVEVLPDMQGLLASFKELQMPAGADGATLLDLTVVTSGGSDMLPGSVRVFPGQAKKPAGSAALLTRFVDGEGNFVFKLAPSLLPKTHHSVFVRLRPTDATATWVGQDLKPLISSDLQTVTFTLEDKTSKADWLGRRPVEVQAELMFKPSSFEDPAALPLEGSNTFIHFKDTAERAAQWTVAPSTMEFDATATPKHLAVELKYPADKEKRRKLEVAYPGLEKELNAGSAVLLLRKAVGDTPIEVPIAATADGAKITAADLLLRHAVPTHDTAKDVSIAYKTSIRFTSPTMGVVEIPVPDLTIKRLK